MRDVSTLLFRERAEIKPEYSLQKSLLVPL